MDEQMETGDYGAEFVALAPSVWQVCFVGVDANSILGGFLKPGYRHAFLLGYLVSQGARTLEVAP
jgi:hypothetical protein